MDKELNGKAKWVADLLAADKVDPSQVTPELCLAYLEEVGRRISRMQNQCLTNPNCSKGFHGVIYSLVAPLQ